jgi:hypothetical protein
MASFYEDASLVVIPSGYKTSKIYAEKPNDGSGDLTFTRASSATRVQSDGLIEKVRTNLILYSEQFNDASWAANLNASATANATTAPNGTATADKIVEDTSTSQHYVGQTPTSITGVGHTISVFAKAAERSFLFLFEDSAGGRSAYFDLSNGTIGTVGGSATASITSVGNGWYRCSVTYTASGTLVRMRVATATANGTASYTGNGTSGIFVWGAQVEVSDFGATAYIPTTTAAVSVGPVSNVPRLDYLGSSCPRLLLEPQRTNLATYSEQADQYTKVGATIGSNVAVSPDGYTNADSIIEDASNGPHAFYNFGLGTFTVQAYTASVFAKKGGRDWFLLSFYDGTTDRIAFFNLANGTAGNVSAGATSTITSIGNGWYRCTITATAAATAGGIAIYSANANGASSYVGTNGLTAGYFYGWQLEAGSYATSYIPTLAASSVTRVADAASKTGISSLIGQTEGVLFADINYNGNKDISGSIALRVYTGTNEAYIFITNANLLQCELYNATLQCAITGAIGSNGRKKIAFAYKQNDFVVYMNGVQIGTDTSGTVGAMANVNVGSYDSPDYITLNGINQALLFKTRLTNSQLAELTTL